jgi:hypothetical protein
MCVHACWIESGGGERERAGKHTFGVVASVAVRREQQLIYRSATFSSIAIPHEPRVAGMYIYMYLSLLPLPRGRPMTWMKKKIPKATPAEIRARQEKAIAAKQSIA